MKTVNLKSSICLLLEFQIAASFFRVFGPLKLHKIHRFEFSSREGEKPVFADHNGEIKQKTYRVFNAYIFVLKAIGCQAGKKTETFCQVWAILVKRNISPKLQGVFFETFNINVPLNSLENWILQQFYRYSQCIFSHKHIDHTSLSANTQVQLTQGIAGLLSHRHVNFTTHY